ncbi:ABC ATP-binding isoform 2 [Micractinium conductrix]|uniref:ABC ATP-binding isoform 2 n=1 Tax=Micractinium conductrix TaxID=554055 RepID=A0A2P6VAC6_9CHLO|nr:ABC ATP-binding isoform 2 [Micractinium conductrix]|eukprot:PSC71035.1 ABC ATP-binding isoform 2 [Micractinium conductrix]
MNGGAVSFARLKKVILVTMQFSRLHYTVTVGRGKKKDTKRILAGVSGRCLPGQLLAVMGPTGSGKTSLINALAGRLPRGGSLEGSVLVNGAPRGRGFRAITAYVLQDDVLFSNLTVRETFRFAANIRLPTSINADTRMQLVEDVISELALGKAADTFIGSPWERGVSGGERKRVNIGVELLSNPSLIFLDEPTSGLDAFQAQNVMEALWTLAGNGRTVVTTIHQPRSSIFQMFDQLLLLSEGRIMYSGEAAKAVAYFSAAGFKCPEQFNPGDFFMDVTSMDYRTPESEAATRRRIGLLSDLYERSNVETEPAAVVIAETSRQDMETANKDQQFANHLAREFSLLFGRAWRQASRNKMLVIVTLAQTLLIGLVLAWLYSGMSKSYAGIQDESGILFFVAIFTAMGSMFGSLTTFGLERGIVNRERTNKAYRVLPYFLARFICDVPLRVGQGLLFGCILYWIVGLNPSAKAFFMFCFLVICEGLTGQGLGTALSAACKDEKVALAVAPVITTMLMLFGGFYANTATIPAVLRWIRYISHLYWAYMGLAVNDFRGRDGWACPPAVLELTPDCTISGDDILNQLGFGGNHIWEAFVGLLGLTFGFNALGYVFLRLSKPKFLPLAQTAVPSKKSA